MECAFIKFYGTKLRVIAPVWSSETSSINVYIDDALVGNFSEQRDSAYQELVYEVTGLNLSAHSVRIVNQDATGCYFTFDAIDVDKDGKLLPYNESISLNKSSLDLAVGNSEQLTATTTAAVGVAWKSSDESIATVDSTGKVTGIKEGQAIITATTTGGLTATCTVNVTEQETIINTARAKGDNTNNASGSVLIIFKGVAESQLSVVKSADVDSVYVGDTFTYTIVVTNTSSKTAKAVVVNDSAPNHIDFNVSGITTTQGKVDSSSTSKNIIVNVGDIPPSGTVTIKVPATVIL